MPGRQSSAAVLTDGASVVRPNAAARRTSTSLTSPHVSVAFEGPSLDEDMLIVRSPELAASNRAAADAGRKCAPVPTFEYRPFGRRISRVNTVKVVRLAHRPTMLRGATLAALTLAVVSTVAVSPSAAATPAAGPELATMGLAVSDFAAGASVRTEGFVAPVSPAVAEYERVFRPGLRFGGYPMLSAESIVFDFGDVGTSTLVFDSLRRSLNTSAGRRSLIRGLLAGLPRQLRARASSSVSAPVSMAVGQGAFRLLARLTLRLGGRTTRVDLVFVLQRLDRAMGAVAFASYPGKRIPASIAILAAQKVGSRFQAAFSIRNLAAPSIGGAAQQGQTLSANPGSWAGAPSGFTYQWARCDSVGANCVPIAGATAQTYVVGTTDRGARIVVTVTAANSVTTSSLASAPTSPIS